MQNSRLRLVVIYRKEWQISLKSRSDLSFSCFKREILGLICTDRFSLSYLLLPSSTENKVTVFRGWNHRSGKSGSSGGKFEIVLTSHLVFISIMFCLVLFFGHFKIRQQLHTSSRSFALVLVEWRYSSQSPVVSDIHTNFICLKILLKVVENFSLDNSLCDIYITKQTQKH